MNNQNKPILKKFDTKVQYLKYKVQVSSSRCSHSDRRRTGRSASERHEGDAAERRWDRVQSDGIGTGRAWRRGRAASDDQRLAACGTGFASAASMGLPLCD